MISSGASVFILSDLMNDKTQDIYGGREPRDVAAYGISEAASYLKIPPTTLRPWVAGRQYPQRKTSFFQPLITTPERNPPRLSFNNLVEAYVLRALRTKHGVSIDAVREAITYAQKSYHIERLLLSVELRTEAGDLLLEYYGKLVNLSKAGQFAMKKLLAAHLKRVEWDDGDIPVRLYPFFSMNEHVDDRKIIVIDARRAFGRPIISRRGISTAAIVDRINAGESDQDIAVDYGLEKEEVEAAILYEEYDQAA